MGERGMNRIEWGGWAGGCRGGQVGADRLSGWTCESVRARACVRACACVRMRGQRIEAGRSSRAP